VQEFYVPNGRPRRTNPARRSREGLGKLISAGPGHRACGNGNDKDFK
jgi:hypothetical protein